MHLHWHAIKKREREYFVIVIVFVPDCFLHLLSCVLFVRIRRRDGQMDMTWTKLIHRVDPKSQSSIPYKKPMALDP